ncbi:MAG: AAA family ATPase [Desulfobacterium sp.]|nr:AAA family ATPase [Desulfobacterium sp.]MBU3948633.1 AAA family ATPase [Pseudomonadota bacterium]MBU4036530.1 AAA family ATPase [Pseudomonadota bacterium]
MSNQRIDSTQIPHEGIYIDFFQFHEAPFSITPDPGFLFLSATHQSVIEKIIYGIKNRLGFVLLTGEVGTGKTTICRSVLDKLEKDAETVYIINPSLSGIEILATILDDLGATYSAGAGKKELVDSLNSFLLTTDPAKPVVIIIDDAQTMPVEALEDLRLLSNLETDKEKLLQMVLVGQPELLATISKPELRQLHQRIAINCNLDYLKKEEISGYIERRLFIAGNNGQVRFAASAINAIYNASKGIPRLINRICDYSLIACYLANEHTINKQHVKQALNEIGNTEYTKIESFIKKPYYRYVIAGILIAFAFFAGYIKFWVYGKPAITHTINNTTTPEVNNKSSLQKPEIRQPSFTILLASHRYSERVSEEASIFRDKGIDSHWAEVDLGKGGIWHRHFAERFDDKAAAQSYITEHGLTDAIILAAPWAIQAGEGVSPEAMNGIIDILKASHFDSYMQKMENGSYRLLIGAFVTRKGAEHAADKIAIPGIIPMVVSR